VAAATIDPDDLVIPLAYTQGEAEFVHYLAKGQFGKRMLQLWRRIEGSTSTSSAISPALRDDWYRVLVNVQRASPQAFRAVMMDPDVAVLLQDQGSYPGAAGQIAVTAAIRASQPATVAVPVARGALFLPGLGTALITADAAPVVAVVRVTTESVTVTAGNECAVLPGDLTRRTSSWHPVRWLSAGTAVPIAVRFATDGPLGEVFGNLYPATSAPYVTAEDEGEWQRAFEDSWRILERERPAHAAAIAAGVRAIVPLFPDEAGGSASSTLAGTFGAIAMSRPSRPEYFAVALVHEFQHAKLAAALDLVDLCEHDDTSVYYAPWRPDPRPLVGLMHGVYAHLGIADFWNVHREQARTGDALLSHVEFIRWRDDTWQACLELADAPSLTPAGRVFARKLLAELERLRTEKAPDEAQRLAGLLALDQKISWRLRNLEADPRTASRLAEAWLRDEEPGELTAGPSQRRAVPGHVPNERTRLLYRYLRGAKPESMGDISAASRYYIAGDYRAALDAYETRVVDEPGDLDAWAGLALAAFAAGGTAQAALATRPELVAETYLRAISAGRELKRPRQLAEWLNAAG
jgi:HEXXH motif-containing protein